MNNANNSKDNEYFKELLSRILVLDSIEENMDWIELCIIIICDQ